jgi:shikimate dehydrogenase
MKQISGKTRVVAVWGHPVSHSRSPAMHNAALRELGLDWVYVPFDVDPARVGEAVAGIRALGLVGVNVTVPLKELIIPHLDWVDDEALRIGSVNTIHNVDGFLRGYSTDGPGFLRALEAAGQPPDGRSVCLLGAGGSARAVAFALASRGSRVAIANRTQERAERLAADVNGTYPGLASSVGWGGPAGECDLIVNTTSLGMHPNVDQVPALPPEALRPGQFVYDLIYAPPETQLLAMAREAGCGVRNGLQMLVYQGAHALAIWSGIPVRDIPVAVMEAAATAG